MRKKNKITLPANAAEDLRRKLEMGFVAITLHVGDEAARIFVDDWMMKDWPAISACFRILVNDFDDLPKLPKAQTHNDAKTTVVDR